MGVLRNQYRMHSSLSVVPRELFYFGDALHDGKSDEGQSCRVRLLPVEGENDDEWNAREVATICELLEKLNAHEVARKRRPEVMVITPYRQQEDHLHQEIEERRARGAVTNLDVELCTLDRCQGREAEYVLISLVRSRATPFLDMPKRWNVALTRAMEGLFIIGDVHAYLEEAKRARSDRRARPSADGSEPGRPQMSLLARIIEAYDHHIARSGRDKRAAS